MWSYWEQDTFIQKPDLVVIGSGIVGLSAVIRYAEVYPKHRVMILEAGPLPTGASTKNAGFACFGSPTEVLMDLENESEDQVLARIEKRWKGLENLQQLLGKENIGLETPGSYELFLKEDQSLFDQTFSQIDRLNRLIYPTLKRKVYEVHHSIIEKAGFQGVGSAISINGEGQINTGLMMKNLIDLAKQKHIQILNGYKVTSISYQADGVNIQGLAGNIHAKKCIIATNGFGKQLLPDLDLKPARAQVLITKPIDNLPFKGTFHFDQGYYYFRNVGNRVLFGGGRNLDKDKETTDKINFNQKIQSHLIELLKTHILPNTPFEIDQQWAGIMGIGSTKETLIEKINDNCVISLRLGGMGIAIGSLIGREAAELLMHE
ncbi:NAD(P)/FAD-dependent oxidoreductase [Reichenbachiella ulvae]|uniref:FAD-binding oxidoreductase n=1 Tax=Reichenbachiella ulvae TaxID=2980104 RepID=A0ABT3CSY1_9BACT|nr:FAD-dependent oxidoreductase [Reichenbachiella ulvae]MCV9386811.1 FAD-binding oxidoreductase [Reichenbachiella ulvae]